MRVSWLRRFRKRDPVPPAPVVTRDIELPGLGSITVSRSIDCTGDSCPRPQLLTMKTLEQMREGEIMELLSDNPASVEAIPAMMLVLYSTHLATIKGDGGWRIYVRKGL
ncbi:MAG: sulfurtransferase TusA family protein [Proteobacteria bacterium]|nr:MAG: sulfurtransferase TusA family protein [Pseudomonadota bacterium]